MSEDEGWKVSLYISDIRMPDYHDQEDTKKIAQVLRRLHSLTLKVDYGLDPLRDARAMERLLKEKDSSCFEGYEGLKRDIAELYDLTKGDGVEKCFCHGDTYRPNWMMTPEGDVILIDWEYAGYSDPGIDVGYYIVDAKYGKEEAESFIREYLSYDQDEKKVFHFLAYAAIIAYYWFVWALYRESCGADMADALNDWRQMAESMSVSVKIR